MAKFYKVEVVMPANLVGPLMELVEGEGKVVTVVPVDEAEVERKRHFKKSSGRIFSRGSDIPTGKQYVLQLLENAGTTGLTLAEISKAFIKAGRAPNSASPATSWATKNLLVYRNDHGAFVHQKFAKESGEYA